MHRRSDLLYSIVHIAIDAIALLLAFILSYQIRGNGLEIYRWPYSEYLRFAREMIPIWIAIFAIQGLYIQSKLFISQRNIATLTLSNLAAWAAFVVTLTLLRTEQTIAFPRLMLLYILVFTWLFVVVGRAMLLAIRTLAFQFGLGSYRTLILKRDADVSPIEAALKRHLDRSRVLIDTLAVGQIDDLAKIIGKHHIDELILLGGELTQAQTAKAIDIANDNHIRVTMVPDTYEIRTSNVLFGTIAGFPVIQFRQTPLEGWGRVAKRLFDISGASIALILGSPIYLVTAIAIRLTDSGPIIYKHKRLGRDGKDMYVYKFRSMYWAFCTGDKASGKTNEEIFREVFKDPKLFEEFKKNQKLEHDPRVTPIGRFIRKTNIDEIPQFLNVLKGDLSLVGPRPITKAEAERYGKWQSYLFSIKPGVTGLWQVSGRNDVSYDERVRLDTYYVENWSLWRDTVIILKTVWMTLFGGSKGAY